MKILMTTDTLGGVWTYAMDLCHELCRRKVRVHLVTMGRELLASQWRSVKKIEGLSLKQTAFRLEWMHDPWADVHAAGTLLLDEARRFEPDLVHLNHYAHGCLPFGCPVVVVGHSCVDTWFRAVQGKPSEQAWQKYREVVGQGIHGADVLVTPTHDFGMQLANSYGAHRQAMTIHNGRDLPATAGGVEHRAKEPCVMSVGRFWDEAKNLAALDAAAGEVEWPVKIAGSTRGPDGGVVDARHAQLLGELEPSAVTAHLHRAAVFASPVKYEPFGLAVLEAALAGCALVISDIATLREVWADAAVYVKPDRPTELAAAINRLIAEPHTLRRMQRRAYMRAQRYDAARMASQYHELYQQLALVEA